MRILSLFLLVMSGAASAAPIEVDTQEEENTALVQAVEFDDEENFEYGGEGDETEECAMELLDAAPARPC